MRVLIYGFTGAVLGGIETFVLNMNEHMSEECVFDYIITGDVCDYRERIEKRGGKILFLPLIRRNPFGYVRSLWRILGEEKKRGTQVFYQQVYSMAVLPPAIMAKLRGYKVILHAHNNGLQKNGKIDILTHKIGKFIARLFRFTYFTNSQLSTDFMFGKGVKAELVYNAIDTQAFSFNSAVRDRIRTEFDCKDKTVVGFVGRLCMQKNPVFMLRVYAEFYKLCANSELWIVGDGELKCQMEEVIKNLQIESSVKWFGRRNDVNQLMQGMDLLLLPSLFEGLGIVLIEAQSVGLPSVSSAEVIPNEAVVTNYIKLLPLTESPSFWARKSLELLSDCGKCLERKDARVPMNYDISFEAKRLEVLIKCQYCN